MFRSLKKTVWQLLDKPLFGTRVIPRDASVDPALFPEDEFPLYCPKCGYLLRGLPDGECPECGSEFERGRLLVQCYVRGLGVRKNSAASRWHWRFLVVGMVWPFISFLVVSLIVRFLERTPSATIVTTNSYWQDRMIYLFAALAFIGPLCCFISVGFAIAAYPRGAWKRRRAVLRAIKQADDEPQSG